MYHLDIGIHATIGSFLSSTNLKNYISSLDIDTPIFWVIILRERYPELYRSTIIGYNWKNIYCSILLSEEYKEKVRQHNLYLRYIDVFDNYRLMFGSHLTNQEILDNPIFKKSFVGLNEIITRIPEKVDFSYIKIREYIIMNKFVKLSNREIEEIFSEYPSDETLIEYILNNYEYDKNINYCIGFYVAIQRNDIRIADMFMKFIYKMNDYEQYLCKFILIIIGRNDFDISIATFDYLYNQTNKSLSLQLVYENMKYIKEKRKLLFSHILKLIDKYNINI